MRRKSIQKTKRGNSSRHIKTRNKKIRKDKDKPAQGTALFSFDKGLKDNYKNLAITYDVNIIDRLAQDRKKGEGHRKVASGETMMEPEVPQTIEVDEEYDLDYIKKLNEKSEQDDGFAKAKPKITEDEAIIIEKLVAKYDDNWMKMMRDIKINVLQWNAHQIQKKLDNYKRKFGDPKTAVGRMTRFPPVKI